MSHACYCDHCSGIAAPPEPAGPCGFPRPDVPGEICGGYEGHDGGHGWWFHPGLGPLGGCLMTEPDHYREAERLIQDAAEVVRRSDDECPEADRLIAEAQVHATLALAGPPTPSRSGRYGNEFDRLVSSWQALEDEHDQIHPDRDECGGVGGCSMMFAATQLEHQMIDRLGDWRMSLAVQEGRAPCRCDHHGDHAGCDTDCECAR